MTIFFTSDTHYGHKNILTIDKGRPFSNVKEMDEELIRRWNSVVKDGDLVYHLGDFIWKGHDPIALLRRLNGSKFLIWGNHDKEATRRAFSVSSPMSEIKIDGAPTGDIRLTLCHYAMRVWNRSHHGALMLHGHSHGSLPGNSQSCDVGVDCWDYTPVTLEQIQARLATLPPYKHEDHHQPVKGN